MNDLIIRFETGKDCCAVVELTREAFWKRMG